MDAVVERLGEVVSLHMGEELAVRGELSRWTTAASGHCYGELRGTASALPVVMYRRAATQLDSPPACGSDVLVRGRPSVYAPRGQVQFVANDLVALHGEGEWRWARAQLLERLATEGLLDRPKREAPPLPSCIGLVASSSSAAYRDVIASFSVRSPWVTVVHAPSRIAGPGAPQAVGRAIDRVSSHSSVEVIVLARGGGDRHSMRTFDTEVVARAICRSAPPVIVAVGHEGDVTVADLVADASVATPTAAAELASIGRGEIGSQLETARAHLARPAQLLRDMSRQIRSDEDRLNSQLCSLAKRLEEAVRLLGPDRLDSHVRRTRDRAHERVRSSKHLLDTRLRTRLHSSAEEACRVDAASLQRLISGALRASYQEVAGLSRAIEAMAPSRVLKRGYAIVRDRDMRVVREPVSVSPGEVLDVEVRGGRFRVEVTNEEGTHP